MDNRRRTLRALTLALLPVVAGALTLPAPAPAQTADDAYRFSTRLPAVGTRALGMSGAGGVAGWADPNALYTNPAGLGYYTTSEISGSLSTLLSRDESTYQIFQDGNAFTETGDNAAVRLGHLTGVYNFETTQGSLVFALGYNRVATFDRELSYEGTNSASSITDTFLPFDDEFEITEDRINVFPVIPFVAFQAGAIEFFESLFQDGDYPFLQAVAPGRTIRQVGTVSRGGTMNEVNFTGAVEAAPNFMVGVGANISFGQYTFEHELTEIDQEGADNYSVVTGNGLLEDFDSMLFREEFVSDFTGINLRFGLSANVNEAVRVGFTAETPTWYSIEEEFTDAFIQTRFSNGSLTYGDDPSEDAGRDAFEYRISTPWRLSTGISYDSDPLLISADVEFVDWSQLSLDADAKDFGVTNDVLEEDYSYVFNWRGGVEYRLGNGLSLRGGAAYRPDARDFTFSLADGGDADRSRLFFSAGAGFQVNDQVTLNLAWMQERSKDQFVPYPSLTPPTESEPIAVPFIDEDVVRNQFQIGATVRF